MVADLTTIPERPENVLSDANPYRARWSKTFLLALEQSGIVKRACETVGISVWTELRERKANAAYAKEYEQALAAATTLLEAEAIRRATHGLRRYKFTKAGAPILDPRTGEQYCELEYSDTLLALLLRARKPSEYREKVTDVTLNNTVQNNTVFVLSEERRAELMRRQQEALPAR